MVQSVEDFLVEWYFPTPFVNILGGNMVALLACRNSRWLNVSIIKPSKGFYFRRARFSKQGVLGLWWVQHEAHNQEYDDIVSQQKEARSVSVRLASFGLTLLHLWCLDIYRNYDF